MRTLDFSQAQAVTGGYWEDDGYGNTTWIEDQNKRRKAAMQGAEKVRDWFIQSAAWDYLKDNWNNNTSPLPYGTTDGGNLSDVAGANANIGKLQEEANRVVSKL